MKRTAEIKSVRWHEGTGEETGQIDKSFDMVTFGSSFAFVTARVLTEGNFRILKPNGVFACMWNHRQLDDEIQGKKSNP